MEDHQKIERTLEEVFSSHSLILAILSNPRKGQDSSKITIRPIIKNKNPLSQTPSSEHGIYYQITESQKVKTSHRNLTAHECLKWLMDQLVFFKQLNIYTQSADYHILVGKKGNITFLKKPSTKTPLTFDHNRQKNYLLQEGQPIPFLVHLGVMNKEGNVYAAKRDKFRQINRFVEIIQDVIPYFNPHQTLRIVDFGCGKAYLTFALYHYLKISKGYEVHITGLDLKEELIQQCEQLAHLLGYQQDLQFIQGDIKDYQTKEKVDLMISLHACDTATDAALDKAIRWKAKVILCVPCCQHELISQVKQEALYALLKHGILKERFAALATDAARAQLLEVMGYRTQVLEFIDLEHTPKNLLIRAIKIENVEHSQEAWQTYLNFKNHLKINPFFEHLLHIIS